MPKHKRTHRDTYEWQRRKEALLRFMARHDLKVSTWPRDAGLSDRTVANFLRGRSQNLGAGTMERLVSVVPGATIDELMGYTEHDYGQSRAAPVRPTEDTEALKAEVRDLKEQLKALIEELRAQRRRSDALERLRNRIG